MYFLPQTCIEIAIIDYNNRKYAIIYIHFCASFRMEVYFMYTGKPYL